MRTRNYAFVLLRLVSFSIALSTACAPPPSFRASADHAGAVTFALGIAPGLTLDTASYTITAPGFTREGSLDLRQSTELSATIGGLPVGDGYLLAIAATLSDGATTCAGSSPFAVTERATTSLAIHLL